VRRKIQAATSHPVFGRNLVLNWAKGKMKMYKANKKKEIVGRNWQVL